MTPAISFKARARFEPSPPNESAKRITSYIQRQEITLRYDKNVVKRFLPRGACWARSNESTGIDRTDVRTSGVGQCHTAVRRGLVLK
eukprot:scaffold765_cov345-Prasinococcus_capsulatus_cf.AAC.3